MALPSTRQRIKAEREERLAAEEKDIAAIEPMVSRVRIRCSTLEQQLRSQIVAAERAPMRQDLLASADRVAQPEQPTADAGRREVEVDLGLGI